MRVNALYLVENKELPPKMLFTGFQLNRCCQGVVVVGFAFSVCMKGARTFQYCTKCTGGVKRPDPDRPPCPILLSLSLLRLRGFDIFRGGRLLSYFLGS